MTLRSRLSNDPNSFLRTLLVCWECAECWCRRTDSEITSNCPEMVCSFGFVVLNAAVFDCPIVNRPLSKQFLSYISFLQPSPNSQAKRRVIRSIKHLSDADSGQYPRTPSRQHSSKRALFSTLSSLSSYSRPFHSKRQNGAPTQVVTVPSLNNPTFTLDKQHSDNENRMDKVDEVDKGTRAAEENQRHIETEVLDELAVDAVDTSVAFEQQLRESSLRDVVLKMKQFLKQSSILMPTLPKSDAPQPFLLLARPKLESMLSSTTNLEKTLPQKSATTTRPTTAIEAAVPADDGRKAEKQTSDSHDKLKLSRQTQKLRKEEVK
ncbi:hypothetical protein BLNAU_18451 [Blattamonas nauphoetae]|uniref:Uncharacterized protein n=1 Tax=Blattamonas nauphoetae TaxID=2049346 RepID=A0ABQ9X8V8_9EUKA|nr:hypothetical protein BLNAU_18451 [Blattamonas nauphoetae]